MTHHFHSTQSRKSAVLSAIGSLPPRFTRWVAARAMRGALPALGDDVFHGLGLSRPAVERAAGRLIREIH